jgi:hypothetical protein
MVCLAYFSHTAQKPYLKSWAIQESNFHHVVLSIHAYVHAPNSVTSQRLQRPVSSFSEMTSDQVTDPHTHTHTHIYIYIYNSVALVLERTIQGVSKRALQPWKLI